MNESRVVIAHRDARTRAELRERLESGHVQVIAECDSGADAIHWIEVLRPTAAYLDVALPDLSADDVLAWLLPGERPATVFLLDGDSAHRGDTLVLCETG
jgi:two-component system LytT family response regulator